MYFVFIVAIHVLMEHVTAPTSMAENKLPIVAIHMLMEHVKALIG